MRAHLSLAALALVACGPGPGEPGREPGVPRSLSAEAARFPDRLQPLAPTPGPGPQQELLAEVAARATERSCTGYCHLGKFGHSRFLETDPGRSAAVPRFKLVEPGKPEESWLWLKLTGAYQLVPECLADPKRCGEPMPRYLPSLTDEEKAAIRRWIESGAAPRWTRYGEW